MLISLSLFSSLNLILHVCPHLQAHSCKTTEATLRVKAVINGSPGQVFLKSSNSLPQSSWDWEKVTRVSM